MVIKYTSEGKCEWGKSIGGSDYDYIDSVIETRDGGYLIEGNHRSENIDLGNGIRLYNSSYGLSLLDSEAIFSNEDINS